MRRDFDAMLGDPDRITRHAGNYAMIGSLLLLEEQNRINDERRLGHLCPGPIHLTDSKNWCVNIEHRMLEEDEPRRIAL